MLLDLVLGLMLQQFDLLDNIQVLGSYRFHAQARLP